MFSTIPPVQVTNLQVFPVFFQERMIDGAMQQAPFEESDKKMLEVILTDKSVHVGVKPGDHGIISCIDVILLEILVIDNHSKIVAKISAAAE